MNRMIKYAAAAGVAGVLAIGMSAPSQAEHGRNAAAAIGFGAGALVGAAAANAAQDNYAYGPDYAYEGPAYEASGYEYAPRYRAEPGNGAYAYAPPNGYGGEPSCATQGTYGKGLDYSAC